MDINLKDDPKKMFTTCIIIYYFFIEIVECILSALGLKDND
jgi:hypothetical protein